MKTEILLPKRIIKLEDIGNVEEGLLNIKEYVHNLPTQRGSALRRVLLHCEEDGKVSNYEVQFFTEEGNYLCRKYITPKKLRGKEN